MSSSGRLPRRGEVSKSTQDIVDAVVVHDLSDSEESQESQDSDPEDLPKGKVSRNMLYRFSEHSSEKCKKIQKETKKSKIISKKSLKTQKNWKMSKKI